MITLEGVLQSKQGLITLNEEKQEASLQYGDGSVSYGVFVLCFTVIQTSRSWEMPNGMRKCSQNMHSINPIW